MATDPNTGKTEPKKVIAAFSGTSYDHLIQVTIDTDGDRGHKTGVILTTEHHLFWDKGTHHWVRADHLTPGEQLRAPNGTTTRVITTRAYPGPRSV